MVRPVYSSMLVCLFVFAYLSVCDCLDAEYIMYMYIYIYMRIYACKCTWMDISAHTRMPMHMDGRMEAHIYACMHACMNYACLQKCHTFFRIWVAIKESQVEVVFYV